MMCTAISASVMVVLILLLRTFLLDKLPKRFFRILWIICALRMLLPFSFSFEIEVPVPAKEPVQTVVFDTSKGVKADDEKTAQNGFDPSVIIHTAAMLGTIISGGFLISAYLRMRKIAVSAKPMHMSDPLCSGADIRSGVGAASAFSCGLFHPIIFIPKHIYQRSDDGLTLIIAHEMRHIRCGDQLVKWLLAAALCLNWYNPLAYVMWHFANRDIELACDEALVTGGTDSARYALCLISAAEAGTTAAVASFGAPVLNERIKFIMKSKKLTVGSFIAAGLVLAIMTVFFVNVSATEVPDGEIDEQTTKAIADILVPDEKDIYVSGKDEIEPEIYVDGEEYVGEELEIELVPSEETDTYLELACPLKEHGSITGRFGENTSPVGTVVFNNGVNVAAEEGESVYAAAIGTVIEAEYDSENGNYVVIDHGDGNETVYRYLANILCEVGDTVETADEIGTVGSTGSVTGPNLGFAVICDGAYISPEPLFE